VRLTAPAVIKLAKPPPPDKLAPLPSDTPDHYAILGLDRRCTPAQIRAAYRLLAKQHHPDLNPGSREAVTRSQELNAAHETLSDPARRRAYDRELDAQEKPAPTPRTRTERNIIHDAHVRIEDFLRGTALEVRVKDPANPHGAEIYSLVIPPDTAPGTRFRLPRAAPFAGGFVQVRVRALPGFRFKVRGSDLRCDLRINTQRASQGGTEMIPGPTGAPLRVPIPAGIGRGEIVRLPGEGLPKPRGGRGDLLIRITYRPEVRINRSTGRA
jgi:DnaJ-class molecular chaperone